MVFTHVRKKSSEDICASHFIVFKCRKKIIAFNVCLVKFTFYRFYFRPIHDGDHVYRQCPRVHFDLVFPVAEPKMTRGYWHVTGFM